MTSEKNFVITLDGPSGSGKSTASVRIAYHFHLPCLDTGAMYRTLALRALERKIALTNEDELLGLGRYLDFQFGFEKQKPIVLFSENGSPFQRIGKEIRTPEVSLAASKIATLPRVREILVAKQREIGLRKGGVIEGRDAGTVIFPDAKMKFFITASIEERAKRRYQELLDKLGKDTQRYEDVLNEMIERDRQDEQRAASPLKPAKDSILLDTTGLVFEEVVQFLIQNIEKKLANEQ